MAFKGAIGRHSLHPTCNENGVRLASLALERGLVIGGTIFQHKDIHKITWNSADGVTRNQIDHILINKRFRRSLLNVRARRGAECNSDHNMVEAIIKVKLKTRRTPVVRVQKVNLNALGDAQCVAEFKVELRNRFEALSGRTLDLNEEWRTASTELIQAATNAFGVEKKRKRKDWFDDECKQAVERGRRKREIWLDKGDRESE